MRIALLVASTFLMIATSTPAPQSPVTRYVGGRWWDGRDFIPHTRCVVDGVFVRCPAKERGRIVDLAGGYVIPPLADAHNHVTGDIRRAIDAGVFYLMNPTILASAVPPPDRRRPTPGKIDVVYAMGAITAPGGHPEALYQDTLRPAFYKNMRPEDFVGDAFHYVATATDIEPVLDRLVAQQADFVKIALLYSEEHAARRDDPAFRGKRGLDPALVPAIVGAAHRRGLRVAAHIETAADFRVIVAAGVDVAVHMPGYYSIPLPAERYAISERDARAAARSGIRMAATAAYALNNPDKASLPTIQAMQRENLRKLKRAQVPILIGTDSLADAAVGEARYLVSLGVMTPREALNTLTDTTPAFIFPRRPIGQLRIGYEASFLVLDSDPSRNLGVLPKAIVTRVKQGVEIASPP